MKEISKFLKKPTVYISIWVIAIFVLGWISGFYKEKSLLPIGGTTTSVRANSPDFKYINPILFTPDSTTPTQSFAQLRRVIADEVQSKISNDNVSRISVYFRDMNKGGWTGVNEKDGFDPSSMLKVVTMIAYIRLQDKNPNIFSEQIYYKYVNDPGQFYKPTPLTTGDYSTVNLIQQMILESDNTAANILNDRKINNINTVFNELRLPHLNTSLDVDYSLSPQGFAAVFRTLYNAAYISNDYAEEALGLLTHTKFDRGLIAGLPKDIVVSHKFGEHSFSVNGKIEKRQLHDCGIIYYPNDPYLLCVMTEGKDFSTLEKTIADISRAVYIFIK